MPSRPSLGSRQVPDEYPFGPSQAVTTRFDSLEPTASRSMWRRKSRFPHGQVDTVPRGFLVVVDHMLDILARVDSEVSIAMPPVCERRLVVHAAVDAGRQVSRTRRQRTAGPIQVCSPSRWLSAAVATGVVSSSRRTVRSTGSCFPTSRARVSPQRFSTRPRRPIPTQSG